MKKCLLCDKLVHPKNDPYCEQCGIAVSKGIGLGIMITLHILGLAIVTAILFVLLDISLR